MLVELYVHGFKSFREARLPLADLTVLIGANASGKSNLLEALQLLSWLAHGRRLNELLYAVKERQLDVRGPLERLAHDHAGGFSLGGIFSDASSGRLSLTTGVELETDGLHIDYERAAEPDSKDILYDALSFEGGGILNVAYDRSEQGGPSPGSDVIACTDQQAVFTQLTTPARFLGQRAQQRIPRAARQIQSALESILFLDPSPRRMRDYSFTVERTLRGDGSNLSAVLYDLCEKQQRKAEVLAFVRSLPEQNILDLTFLSGPRGEVMAELTESFGGDAQTYEAALLSDGTLRVLAVAAALLSVPAGALVVIEEIDNGVHPTRAKLLLDNIQRVARERKLRVLLTTHNPALLDAIPVEAIPDVVACFRDPKDGDSRLMPLRQLQDYPELVAQGPVGQLVTRGILERYLKAPKGPEEKAAQAQKVLEMLQSPAGEP
ncbi:MAG TPA: ATP-binding protein [Archangium sp.]|nr:ATP-binding protein [Archangium sp.]